MYAMSSHQRPQRSSGCCSARTMAQGRRATRAYVLLLLLLLLLLLVRAMLVGRAVGLPWAGGGCVQVALGLHIF